MRYVRSNGGAIRQYFALLWYCIAAPQKISLPKICGFWGVRAGARIRGALQLGSSAQSFPRTRPICAVFPGLKVLSEENLVKCPY